MDKYKINLVLVAPLTATTNARLSIVVTRVDQATATATPAAGATPTPAPAPAANNDPVPLVTFVIRHSRFPEVFTTDTVFEVGDRGSVYVAGYVPGEPRPILSETVTIFPTVSTI